MSKHRSQVRHSPALLYVYPVDGHNALRPSDCEPDAPTQPNRHGELTWEEQREWDAKLARGHDPNDKASWAYWDRVRKFKTLSPRSRKRTMEREAKRKH